MPRGNGNGPMGMGPKTGCGAGYCAGFAKPGNINRGGPGGGRGIRCRGRWTNIVQPALDERKSLESRAEMLQRELAAVKGRLAAIHPGQ